MFTLSFYRNQSTDKTVVCTDLYSVTHGSGITTIAINPIGGESGVDFKLCRFEDHQGCNYFGSVYVTNTEGKTIDHYDAPKERPASTGVGNQQ